ncbi:MAG: hypothetical protein OEZ57_15220 [Nitrospirota bacterium]|nr:hypothetical protein [Nitrospirota bacterium]
MKKVKSLLTYTVFSVLVLPILVALGGALLPSVASAAEWSTPTFGGSGGTRSYNLDCGRESVMVGLMYKSGSWLDEIGVICRKVNDRTGSLGEEFTKGPVGGVGGSPRISKCVPGGVIGSLLDAQWGNFLNHVVLGCYEWDASRKRPGRIQKVAPSINIQVLVKAGSKCGLLCNFSGRFVCPSGKAAKALRGKYGGYIDSTRFVCDAWDQ